MYVSPGRLVGGAVVGGAGAAGTTATGGTGALARTGAPLLLLTLLGVALLVGGFLLLRARLQATGDAS